MSVRILHGDCREVLKTLPSDSVHCCVTSPPYWGLRDYGVSGQIGLESTFTEFIDEMVKVFREVRRVLGPDGTLWLNLGDSYATGTSVNRKPTTAVERHGYWTSENITQRINGASDGLKPKDLCGIPWRVALALQEDGWWLRQDIIWSKPNPMPESVTDRCTKAHEYLFLLSKSARYYFDAEAIKETAIRAGDIPGGSKKHYADTVNDMRIRQGLEIHSKHQVGESRNKRSVWEIATSPFPEAHFATFPPALVEPCIKAGTSEKGCCGKCGAPWVRETKTGYDNPGNRSTNGPRSTANREFTAGFEQRLEKRTETLGWSPTCTCQAPVIPCTVLDPFGGAGTTVLVADRLQRDGISIDLNPEYVEMQKRRIFGDAPLFAEAQSPG